MRLKFSFLLFSALIFTLQISAQNLQTTISSIGCKQISPAKIILLSQNPIEHKQWLKDKFGVISKTSFLAKCSVNGTFYKFLFEEEIFENAENAASRLKNLQTLPDKEHDKSDYAVPKILGEGFVRGKKLYTVGAFAVFIEDAGFVKKYRDKLAKKIKE